MSIVERAAELLRQANPPQRTVVTPPEQAIPSDTLIEKLAEKKFPHPPDQSVAPSAQSSIVKPPSLVPGVEAVSKSRTVAIDLDYLRSQNVITPDAERSPVSESFRRIKRHILSKVANSDADLRANLIMVTSSLPGEGKTFSSVNLAMSIAMEVDKTVLLVDADVAMAGVSARLGINTESHTGLMDILLDPSIKLNDVLCKTNIGKLSVLPSGRRHARATEMLASEAMKSLLQEMADRYRDRVIIFDTPPLMVSTEASVIAGLVGQVIVVVEAGRTSEIVLKNALSRIGSHSNVGVLLNKAPEPDRSQYGDYGYGYGYG